MDTLTAAVLVVALLVFFFLGIALILRSCD